MAKEAAVRKRALIDQANKNMFIVVAVASVILGLSVVGAIYIGKWIIFNAKVIGEKGKIIDDYNTSISNLPALNNAVMDLSENSDLELVARNREVQCETFEGEIYTNIEAIRECSALRVIPDALPATRNPEALLASLNQIFLLTGTSPESLSPSDSNVLSPITGVGSIPVALSIAGDSTLTRSLLDNIEKSIRTFEMGNVTIEWRGTNTILLRGQATAFYSSEVAAEFKTKTIYADETAGRGSTHR